MSGQASSSNHAAAPDADSIPESVQVTADDIPKEPTGIEKDKDGNEKLPRADKGEDRVWVGEIIWIQPEVRQNVSTTGLVARVTQPLRFRIKGWGLPESVESTRDDCKFEVQIPFFRHIGQKVFFTIQKDSDGNVKRQSCYLPPRPSRLRVYAPEHLQRYFGVWWPQGP